MAVSVDEVKHLNTYWSSKYVVGMLSQADEGLMAANIGPSSARHRMFATKTAGWA